MEEKIYLHVGVCVQTFNVVVIAPHENKTVMELSRDDALMLASALVEAAKLSDQKKADNYSWASVSTNPRRPMGDA